MAIERRLGTEDNPDIVDQSKQIDIPQDEPSIEEQIAEALEVEITDDGVFVGQIEEESVTEVPFDANIAEYLDDSVLGSISNKLVSAVENDKESRKEWEKTYTDGLKYYYLHKDQLRHRWLVKGLLK